MVDLSKMTKEDVGKLFDHSVLPKYTQEHEIIEGCKQAIEYNCAAFYTSSPYYTPLVKELLKDSDVLVGAAIGFPFGGQTVETKVFETKEAIRLGAEVVDVCMNVGALKDKKYDVVLNELKEFKAAAEDAITKVILEVAFLTDEEIAKACELINEAGIDYAKTSSGQFDGPSMKQFLIMKKTLEGTKVKLKVSGVKFPRPQNAYAFIMAGAELIGTRSAPGIIDGLDMCREIGIVPAYEEDYVMS